MKYSLIIHELWVPSIKFMVTFFIHVRRSQNFTCENVKFMITYITSYTRKHTCLCILFIFLAYSIIIVEMRDLNPEYLRNTRRCQSVELQGIVLLNLLDFACVVDVFLDVLESRNTQGFYL